MNHTIYLALGTNVGDRLQNLEIARQMLQTRLRLTRQSPIYETAPWGYLDQENFLNQVIEAQTKDSPVDLFNFVKSIENEMGRVKIIKDGPRLIDIDILFYDDLIYNSDILEIPHPRMRGRSFVLVPLANLIPDRIHPLHQISVSKLAAETDPTTLWPYKPQR